ncbi:porin family protein [Ferruginibacter albus]|uniref:porin family protein n=1 Tax=Ferruginibacter albus TaxID=2875540 RepID=UPI001CC726C1|nr:porin family protein [Ferruginibacter albus]UAY51346.1 porin family protein [Ferruginibacter albus]
MRKIFALTLIAISFASISFAQKDGTRFSGGVELGFPTGSFGDVSTFGIGASLQAEHFFQENVSGTVYFGFLDYFGKSISSSVKYKATTILPLRIGARYYIGDGLHLGAQLGVGFISSPFSSTTGFAYSPQIGYNFKTNKGKAVDLTFKYDGYAVSGGSLSALGIRAAYIF